MATRVEPYFTPATFRFLRALKRNNRRDWFHAHKDAYEAHVRTPCLRLITDLGEPLRAISPVLVANPRSVGGSLFRIHRDTRFSNDKSPYKTYAGMSFYHLATRATARGSGGTAAMGRLDAPVLYLHLAPGDSFTGGGIWHPQPETLKRIRDFLLDNPRTWKAVSRDKAFRRVFELTGDALSRPPRGYDPAHELIEDLKRKDFVTGAPLTDAELMQPDLLKVLVRRFRLMRPFIEYLCASLELEF
jgi:uncharacterized protein (TIGR02453 family)